VASHVTEWTGPMYRIKSVVAVPKGFQSQTLARSNINAPSDILSLESGDCAFIVSAEGACAVDLNVLNFIAVTTVTCINT
jgi:hypothetical protein